MSLQARERYPIPAEAARVARAIFPKGNLVMRLSDELGMNFHDQDCADLFPIQGQPAEGLTDRQAAEAVRTRIDWQYLLGLELADPGFDHSVLSEFRQRLLTHQPKRAGSRRSGRWRGPAMYSKRAAGNAAPRPTCSGPCTPCTALKQ